MVAGGHNRDSLTPDQELIGDTEINTFNYQSNTWSLSPNRMEQGRWYPSSVMLGSGEIGIFSGAYWDGITRLSNGRPKIDEELAAKLLHSAKHLSDADGKEIRNYPYMHWAADGRVFGLSGKSHWFYDKSLDLIQTIFPLGLKDHFEGSSVLYDTEPQK